MGNGDGCHRPLFWNPLEAPVPGTTNVEMSSDSFVGPSLYELCVELAGDCMASTRDRKSGESWPIDVELAQLAEERHEIERLVV